MRERVVRYRGEKILVTFHVDRCTHVAECILGLPEVFDVRRRPWVDPNAASPDHIAEVIHRCPTGALHYERLDGGPSEPILEKNTITIVKNGPLYFRGSLIVKSADQQVLFTDTRLALCRCGASKNKPFCDNWHELIDFVERGEITSQKIKSLEHSGPLEITCMTDGPLVLSGPVEIIASNGMVGFRGDRTALCRCGGTKNPPFCDGTHTKIHFQAA